MSTKKEKLKSIKTSVLSRGLALTKTTLTMSAQLASHAIEGVFSDQEKKDRIKNLLNSQMDVLAKELGSLKGSLMKAGQMLSMYGEYFLPPEAAAKLRSLQNQSPALDWPAIEAVLKNELGEEKYNTLEIDQEPIGTASLGQVHKARIKGTNHFISLKVQYPGVADAIDSDLTALKRLLSLSNLLPKGMSTDAIFSEIKNMLQQEVDYTIESSLTKEFKTLLEDDSRYIVPTVYDNYSTQHILATSFEVGVPVISDEVLNLPLERRNKLGIAVNELYLKELFVYGKVQTDPHFGNYLVRIDYVSNDDKLILLDWGATRTYDLSFLNPYREMVIGSVLQDRERVLKACLDMKFLTSDDSKEVVDQFVELCYEICEPFYVKNQRYHNPKLKNDDGSYNWELSDLPTRLSKRGTQIALVTKFRPPPQEVVFLDRKMTGLFVFLQKLKTCYDPLPLIQKYLK